MKMIKIAALSLLLSIGMSSCKKEVKEETTTTTTTTTTTPENDNVAEDVKGNEVSVVMEKASFEVEGMTCAVGCAAKIEKDLAALPGVKNAKVDFETKKATVEFDNTKQTINTIQTKVQSIANGAYKVKNINVSKEMAMVNDQDDKTKQGKGACCSKDKAKSCGDKSNKKDACSDKSKKSKKMNKTAKYTA